MKLQDKGCIDNIEGMFLEGFWGIVANVMMMSIGVTENIPCVGMFATKSVPYIKRIVSNLKEEDDD
jgi:hypothetical protein